LFWFYLTVSLNSGVVGQGNKEMYKKVIMADLIKEIALLSMDDQESVLKNLSDSMIPLEIDGNVYMIHIEVSKLIDNLVMQIKDLKNRDTNLWTKE